MENLLWNIVAVIVGGCISVIGAMIAFNLRSIKKCLSGLGLRIDKQDDRIEKTRDEVIALSGSMSACKIDCDRTFVNSEVFLRETGFARRTMENVTSAVNRVEGKLTVVEKLPQICGNISREIVKEMKNGAPNERQS